MAETIFGVAAFIAVVGFVLTSFRFAKGPGFIDRTVALDVLTIIMTSLIAAFAIFAGRKIYLDVAFVYGLVSFAGVVAIARYLEGGL